MKEDIRKQVSNIVLENTHLEQKIDINGDFLAENFLHNNPYIIEEELIKSYPTERITTALSGIFNLIQQDQNIAESNILLLCLDDKRQLAKELNPTIEHSLYRGDTLQYNGTIRTVMGRNGTELISILVKKKDNHTNGLRAIFSKVWLVPILL